MQLHYCNIYVVVQVFYPEPILSYEGLTNYCVTHDVTINIADLADTKWPNFVLARKIYDIDGDGISRVN